MLRGSRDCAPVGSFFCGVCGEYRGQSRDLTNCWRHAPGSLFCALYPSLQSHPFDIFHSMGLCCHIAHSPWSYPITSGILWRTTQGSCGRNPQTPKPKAPKHRKPDPNPPLKRSFLGICCVPSRSLPWSKLKWPKSRKSRVFKYGSNGEPNG